MQSNTFFDRDLSWLSFNGRVLAEAENKAVPLLERIKFLSIYSSNLDEFYRVRMPAVMALQKIKKKEAEKVNQRSSTLQQAIQIINQQQEQFGSILRKQVIPQLKEYNCWLLYDEPIPDAIQSSLKNYFYTQVLAFLQPVYLSSKRGAAFFPENNKLYLLTIIEKEPGKEELVIVNIPSDSLDRFYAVQNDERQYVVFLDDILKGNLSFLFKGAAIKGAYSFKITRDAELELEDEYDDDVARRIEKQLAKRDFGLATRFLYEPGIPSQHLQSLVEALNLQHAMVVQGGCYHNLKDLMGFPLKNSACLYPKWPALAITTNTTSPSLFDSIAQQDLILHTPYQSYDAVLRFFNEAATDEDVTAIYVTLYRMAQDSRIASALVSAAHNGKEVVVLVELKARFDEANNIRWAKKMKAAGVTIEYSDVSLKVHAKIALVKRKQQNRISYYGLLATGNMNEGTARFYTDHILFTAHPGLLRELELLFIFLSQRKKAGNPDLIRFEHLLVAQFNLQQRFLQLIDREIAHAQQGLPSGITIKLNNLEERVLIAKLYEASQAGVPVRLIVRSICCLQPGVPGMSDNITITRIVDRYLEHGRLFVFHNNGNTEVYMGSADWMNRNIYRRIEVCFPIYDEKIKQELLKILQLQVNDTIQAVRIDDQLNNNPIPPDSYRDATFGIRSQEAIYTMLAGKLNKD